MVKIMKMLKAQSNKDLHGTLTLPHTPSPILRLSACDTGAWPKLLKWNMWTIWICVRHKHNIENSFEIQTACCCACENTKEIMERLVTCVCFVSVFWSKFCWSGHQWEAFMNLPLHAHVYMCTHILTQPHITQLNTQHQHDSGLPGNHMGFRRLCVHQALFRPCLFSPPTLNKLTNTTLSALFDIWTKNFGWII